MEKFSRSKSTRDEYMQPRSMNDLRSYSTSDYNPPHHHQNLDENFKEMKIKKSRINADSKSWSFNMDPELLRKKRIAGYKAYGVEGKMKSSFRKSFRWIKDACTNVVNGFR
ncbi:uncharacterized protein LOC131013140 [Salvia miltiorrhiza]|uniref:uncharacterized protein LOC131013140 n=1 Tax=Salvia miltiorrhiza TaxID=226208 RepID=UPI0025AC285D|nr:uncharacterized protein LOC131013140 [Salvia miltiorrhiza]